MPPWTRPECAGVASAFEALEDLDEDVSAGLLSAPSRRRTAPSPQQAHDSDSALPADVTPPANTFIALLKRKELWEHNRLTNAMNPTARSHDPALRPAYAILSKPDQKMVWHLIPRASAQKQPAAPLPVLRPGRGGVARGGRAAAAGTAGAGRAAKAHVTSDGEWSHVPDPFGSQAAPAAARDGETKTCVVCLDRPQAALLLPCRHTVLCLMCAFQVQECSGECPFCRVKIEDILSLQ